MSTPADSPRELRTPDNAIILHIGVHKTGSTALQATLAAARPDLAQRRILYPGSDEAHHAAAWAVTGFSIGFGDEARSAKPRTWKALVRAAQRHEGRVVISSEFFGRMHAGAVQRVVHELGPSRVHVMFGVRRLSDLLPSSWQQYLKTGLTASYGAWLRDVLGAEDPTITKGFWQRADFAALVKRWGKVVPPERITAVILDPDDRGLLYRTTAELLGLPSDWLDAYRVHGRENRSMTAAEAELVRQVNVLVREQLGWSDYASRIRHGAVRAMVEQRVPTQDEPRIATPGWALRQALRRQRRDRRRLVQSGITVVGNPDLLLTRPRGARTDPAVMMPTAAAAAAVAAAAGLPPQ